MYFGALVSLVRNGLTDEDPALKGAYLNSYQVRHGVNRDAFYTGDARGVDVVCGVMWWGWVGWLTVMRWALLSRVEPCY